MKSILEMCAWIKENSTTVWTIVQQSLYRTYKVNNLSASNLTTIKTMFMNWSSASKHC